jgi:hypothetical protein
MFRFTIRDVLWLTVVVACSKLEFSFKSFHPFERHQP